MRDCFREFNDVMQEYLNLGHAEMVPITDLEKPHDRVFYLPMHAVYKASRVPPVRWEQYLMLQPNLLPEYRSMIHSSLNQLSTPTDQCSLALLIVLHCFNSWHQQNVLHCRTSIDWSRFESLCVEIKLHRISTGLSHDLSHLQGVCIFQHGCSAKCYQPRSSTP